MNVPPAVSCRLVPLLAMVAVLSACAGPPAKPDPTTPPATPSATAAGCPASGVVITTGQVDAAMGLRVMAIDLLNCGAEPYTVRGYPNVRVFDDERRPIDDVKVLDGTKAIAGIERLEAAPRQVTAKPGERLQAFIVWKNLVVDTGPTTTIQNLEIAPADARPAQTVMSGQPIHIDLGTTGRLAVSPWVTPFT